MGAGGEEVQLVLLFVSCDVIYLRGGGQLETQSLE